MVGISVPFNFRLSRLARFLVFDISHQLTGDKLRAVLDLTVDSPALNGRLVLHCIQERMTALPHML